jgi:hypothetical protein
MGKGRDVEADRETDEWAELLGPFTKPQVDPAYRNQPIPREAANTRLSMLARDWVSIDKKITDSMTALMNAATDLQEALSGMEETTGVESEVRLCRMTCWMMPRFSCSSNDNLPSSSPPLCCLATQDIQQADWDFRQLIDRQYEVTTRKTVIESMRHDFQLDKPIVRVPCPGASCVLSNGEADAARRCSEATFTR